ncbi:cell division protein FtsK [Alkalilimnicola ehrlichii]|uniref:DNA translocase FtsK n=1 Tax=Alkalilimnicola ehrlichii TaxID=351052 RepID=UPI000E2ED8C4|nr:DNA translocase FtsK [Alkalilimnicola ehrlichii]RFA28373.1 cell division protein FtsK [Alkalilimnicola ehrlichii]
MDKTDARKSLPSPLGHHVSRGLREAALFLLLALAAFLMVALVTYSPTDPGWSYSSSGDRIDNAGGVAGAYFADLSLYLFGYLAYLFPVMLAYAAWQAFRWQRTEQRAIHWGVIALRGVGFLLTVLSGAALATLHFDAVQGTVPLTSGGILGDLVGEALHSAFNFLGATLFSLAAFLAGVTLFTGLSWVTLMDVTGRLAIMLSSLMAAQLRRLREYWLGRQARKARTEKREKHERKVKDRKPPKIEASAPKVKVSKRAAKEQQMPLFEGPTSDGRPPASLLNPAPEQRVGYSKEALEAMSRQVELKLADFGVEVEVVEVHPGPVITRFELQPAAGVKVSQISNLAKDLARALSVIAVRVVEVIPGKSTIGLEIPNEERQLIALSEIIRSREYERSSSPLTMALGKDIAGLSVVADLAKMPHLLVAGTTGSGKSVGVNAMILSLLYKNTPESARLIMIDPKMLELSVYDGIPHLLAPVVTDMKEAANALRWCVAEMERRYRLMASLGVRNISGYNKKVRDAAERGEPISDPLFKPDESALSDEPQEIPKLEPLPYIVVVVDEFADMMMVVGKKVEELIARLAQKARAAGVHLILATQRPSVDVITGLIKANIPSRIAFQVSSKVDSRTILDQMGAENLLGHGDMLYLAPGTGLPQRVHGAFVADNEVHQVVEYLKTYGEPEYIDEILNEPVDAPPIPGLSAGNGGGDGEGDPLYDQAVRVVTETRRASVSGVQRRLKVGYNRAARLVEEMEAAGVVGPLQPNGSREVLAPPPPKD